jgi:glycosyltransferase involved in cell wall biosynthesis
MQVIKINVYAENIGWLFEDLKQHFNSLNHLRGFEVLVSDRPLASVDAWVALRTKEASASPDLRRTVVCIHDLFGDEGLYESGGSREAVRDAGAVVLSHPDQRRLLAQGGISLQGVPTLERPLGALSIFTPRSQQPDRFSVGWVGRNHARKRLGWFVQAVQELGLDPAHLRVSLIGSGLGEATANLLADGIACRFYDKETHPIAAYPRLYQNLDCLVITGTTEAGPLPLFEALATGLPVVSTPVGWAPYFSNKSPRYVRLANNPHEIAVHLEQLRIEKQELFDKRFEIARIVAEWSLDSWFRAVLELASTLASPAHSSTSAEPSRPAVGTIS